MSVYSLLRKKYPEQECVLLCEVSDTTGGRNRSADFIVVNLWPSRGNSIIGFEQKTWRNDWLNELKRPEKQEAIYKYCDYFYLITDKEKVAKIEEIPINWGWMHCEGERIKVIKQAPKLQSTPCTRQFMCAMLRRAAAKEKYIHIDEIQERIDQSFENGKAQASNQKSYRDQEYEHLLKQVKEFQEASGIEMKHYTSGKQVGDAVKEVLSWDGKYEERLKRLANTSREILKEIETRLEQFKTVDV